MLAVPIVLAVLIAAALYFDREDTDDDTRDDQKRINHSNVVDPPR